MDCLKLSGKKEGVEILKGDRILSCGYSAHTAMLSAECYRH